MFRDHNQHTGDMKKQILNEMFETLQLDFEMFYSAQLSIDVDCCLSKKKPKLCHFRKAKKATKFDDFKLTFSIAVNDFSWIFVFKEGFKEKFFQ